MSLFVLLGFGALVGLLFLAVKVVSSKMGGWKGVAERFPMRDVSFTGETFRKRAGNVGEVGSSGRGMFDIRLATEGFCIYPFFARRNPCLVPWSAIRRVSVSDTSLLVVVDYERTLEFFLPRESLPTFRSKLSSSLFHEAVSPFEAAKKLLQDGTQPRWMSAIAGRAVRLAEKELEKEKKRREQ
jgi:hypothetical protein